MKRIRLRVIVWTAVAVVLVLIVGLYLFGGGAYDTGDPDQINRLLTTSTADP